jgi:hypothetical protein
MSIALVWAHQVGEWLSRTMPIPIKTHARKLYSTFRYGLDYLRQLLFAPEARKTELYALPGSSSIFVKSALYDRIPNL